MDLTHRFTVPTGVEETWAHFQDLGALAECFPGATIGDYDEQNFSGSVKVKLGPIALVYNGSGTFVEKDDEAHYFVVDAKGKDKRGNGTAGAKVTLSMSDAAGSTDVEVLTDLAITGKPAQFGRGVMQDVSDKLLGQFVGCLEQRLTSGGPQAAVEDETASATSLGDEAQGEEAAVAASPAAPGATGSEQVDPAPGRHASESSTSSSAPTGPRAVPSSASDGDDALDLGAAVIPVLAKAYWKQGVAAALVLLVIGWLVRRD